MLNNFITKLFRPISETSGISEKNIVASSEIPVTVDMGNLNFEKKYEESIELGKELLQACPPEDHEYMNMIHVNLMVAYFNSRNSNPTYFDLSTYHAKQSMLNGHNTGYVQKRLVINLEKSNKIYQAIQVCDIILSGNYFFSDGGGGTKEEFLKRKGKLTGKLIKTEDIKDPRMFDDKEISFIYKILDENNRRKRINEINRIKSNDLLIGFEIRRSRKCDEECKTCGKLAGLYPMNFNWSGWHDGCKCLVFPAFQNSDDFSTDTVAHLRAALNGEEYNKSKRAGTIKVLPEQFTAWYKENVQQMDTYPDFICDNMELIKAISPI